MTVRVTGGDTASGPEAGLWVPVSELARMRGLARQVMYRKVDRLLKAGQIEVRTDEAGTRLVSPAQVDRVLGAVADLGRVQGAATRRQAEPAPALPSPPHPAEPESSSATYTREQARRMAYQADLAQLELEERRGRLVPSVEVRTAAMTAGEAIARTLDRLPQAADDLAVALTREGAHGVRLALKALAIQMRGEIDTALAAVMTDLRDTTGDGAAGAPAEHDPDGAGL